MKKNIILLSALFCINNIWGQEVGINTDTPNAILEVQGNKIIADTSADAVIIPRVSHIDWNGKNVGQLIFLEKENTDTDKNKRGFYWWDGTKWIPFLSTAQTSINRTITYAKLKSEFAEGSNFTTRTLNEVRTFVFDDTSLLTANPSDFSFDNGALVINKAGYYNISASISLWKTVAGNVRDTFDMIVLVNGVAPSTKNGNFDLKSTNSFPNGTGVGTTISATGSLKLDAGDKITIQTIKSTLGRMTNQGTAIISINPNADSNITLQYLGDF